MNNQDRAKQTKHKLLIDYYRCKLTWQAYPLQFLRQIKEQLCYVFCSLHK